MADCRDCGTTLVHEDNVGWVDSLSGDEGGTYDVCPGNDQGHVPETAAEARLRSYGGCVECASGVHGMTKDGRCVCCSEKVP